MDPMNPIDRLIALKQHTGMSLKRMSEEAGINTSQTLYEIKKGRHSFSMEVANKIHKRWPEISRGWLMSGEGDMILGNPGYEPELVATNISRVPLLPVSAFAGPIKNFVSDGITAGGCETILSPSPGAELAIPVSGDSMEPVLHDGTIIFVKRINDRAFIPWGQTMVIDTENGAFVKDLFPGDEDTIIARSKNPRYPDMHIPHASIYGIYRVVNAIRSFGVM